VSTAPRWFVDALAMPRTEHIAHLDGTALHYLRWGQGDKPGLVLVHGGAAHAEWWSFLAPLLTRHYDVVAPDLSGHGDSGRRDLYPRRTWADELQAVIADAGFAGPPVVVGHSMGGLVSIVAASLYGDQLAGAVIVDAPVRRPDPESEERRADRSGTGRKVYATLEEAISRFRLIPAQPCENGYIIDHIARTSLRSVEGGGWAWKFDPQIFVRASLDKMSDYLATAKCRVAMFRGEHSVVVPPDTSDYMYELLQRRAPVVEIPDAYHHLILDQPLAFIAALRTLLADWEHSIPKR
jgi:pimeloyl-ACP methyl ester carboxylesterase